MSHIVKCNGDQFSLGRVLLDTNDKAVVSDREFGKFSRNALASELTDLGPGILLTSPVTLSGLTADGQIAATINPGFDGRIKDVFAIVTTAASTGGKTAAIGVFIDKVLGTSEVQTLTKANAPTGGTFTLTLDGEETGNIDYNASAATIQTALLALSNMEAGDVVCTGGPINTTPVVCTFGGKFAGEDVPALVVDNTLLTNATEPTLTPSTDTAGAAPVNEIQLLTPGGTISGGTWTITYDGQTTAALDFDAVAGTIEAALVSLSNIAPGDVTVTGGPISSGVVTLTFGGLLAGANLPQVTVNTASLTGAAPTLTPSTSQAGSAGTDEVQLITPANSPTGGTWTITYAGQTTAAIPAAAVAADIQDALSDLSNVGVDDIVVTGGPITAGVVTLTFSGAGLDKTNVAQVTVEASGLTTATDPNVLVTTGTPGAYGVDEAAGVMVSGGELGLTTAKVDAVATIIPASMVTPRIGSGGPDFDSSSRITFRLTSAPTAFSEGAVMFGLLVAPQYKPGAAVI